jgi:hypothetical protein
LVFARSAAAIGVHRHDHIVNGLQAAVGIFHEGDARVLCAFEIESLCCHCNFSFYSIRFALISFRWTLPQARLLQAALAPAFRFRTGPSFFFAGRITT